MLQGISVLTEDQGQVYMEDLQEAGLIYFNFYVLSVYISNEKSLI